MLSFIRECGNSTVGSNARPALRMRVNMSEIGSIIRNHQLAFTTPGIKPLSAASRKVRRETPNLRR